MGFLGPRQHSLPPGHRYLHPNISTKRRIYLGAEYRCAKKQRVQPTHVPHLDGLPLEILEQVFVESANPEFVLTNKALFHQLNSNSRFLHVNMLLNWVEEKEPETREVATAEPEQNEAPQNEGEQEPAEMTQAQIDQDINNHIHHPQTFHIDDMVVDPPAREPEAVPEKKETRWTLPVEHLKWKFVTSELLESLGLEVSGDNIPEEYGSPTASQRQKELLPLLKKSGMNFKQPGRVLVNAAADVEHFKHLVKLDFGAPTIAALVATLRHTRGEDLLNNRNNMDLLPNWLIRSGYYVDKLASDELWTFLVASPDRNHVRYFLQLGVVPSERLLHQIPAL
ncbi:hypothetical protein CJU89_5083 [Yarrowia sp. B02]|nr:hypothetical protein CJU89_5083 [Yarrowia sp. B02]